MRSANLLNDFAFKYVFGEDCKEANDALKSLLTVFLERKVNHVVVKNSEMVKDYSKMKNSRLDLLVEFDDQTTVDLEMQLRQTKDHLPNRFNYYLARLHGSQDMEGKSYSQLKETIVMIFFNLILVDDDEICSTFTMRKWSGIPFVKESEDCMKLITVEMPKVDLKKPLSDMNEQEKLSLMHFNRLRNNLPHYTFEQKKVLCMWIKELPHDRYDYSIQSILKKIGLSRSSYYSILSNDNYGMKDKQDEIDFQCIKKVMDYKGFKKGSRTIYMMLPGMCGVHFGRAKILRLMKKYGCVCTVRKERPELKTNRENLKNNRKPNLLKRRFRLARPNEILLTDVSYLKYSTNKIEYFSCIKDAVTGRIVNHVTSTANDLSLATDTIACLDSTENTLFHSDQGILYFNNEFQNKLKELGYEQSMSRRGNCWDNSSQESYFGHMKDECDFSKCSTPEDVKKMVDEYVYYYNYERPQWSRNKMTPVDYEKYLDSMSDGEYSEYMEIEQEKYDKMMEKAGIKALKRAVELGAFTQEKLELWLK